MSAEIETLKDRLHQRSQELNRLNNAHESGQAENASLRDKLQVLQYVSSRVPTLLFSGHFAGDRRFVFQGEQKK